MWCSFGRLIHDVNKHQFNPYPPFSPRHLHNIISPLDNSILIYMSICSSPWTLDSRSPRCPHPAAGQTSKRPEILDVNSRTRRHGLHWTEKRIRCHLDPQVTKKAVGAVSSLHTTATSQNNYIPCPRTISSAVVNNQIHFSSKPSKETREPTKFLKTKQRPAHTRQVTNLYQDLPRRGQVLVLLVLELVDLTIQLLDCVLRGLDWGASLMPPLFFLHPSIDPVLLFPNTTFLCVDLGANFTLFGLGQSVHDELHSASFAGSILLGAVLAEVTPLVAVAGHSVLVVEAHFGEGLCFRQSGSSSTTPETDMYSGLQNLLAVVRYLDLKGCLWVGARCSRWRRLEFDCMVLGRCLRKWRSILNVWIWRVIADWCWYRFEYVVLRGALYTPPFPWTAGMWETNSPSTIALKPDGHHLVCSSCGLPPPAFTFKPTDNAFLQVVPFVTPGPHTGKDIAFPVEHSQFVSQPCINRKDGPLPLVLASTWMIRPYRGK